MFVPTNKHIEPQTELKFVGAYSFRSHSWVSPVFITLNQPLASFHAVCNVSLTFACSSHTRGVLRQTLNIGL